MSEIDEFMKQPATGSQPLDIPTDRPTSARAYGWTLGGKDNYEIDREHVLGVLDIYPECVDAARQNRQFLYRAVRYLTRDAGIKQFLDLGSGLPTENNVHQVAQMFQPDARVVYVDIDPIVSVHGQALLADDQSTIAIRADMTDPESILKHEGTQRLIDFNEPVGVLLFAVLHCIPDDDAAQRAMLGPLEAVVPGSYLAISHVVADDQAGAQAFTDTMVSLGMPWKTRLPSEVDGWVSHLEPVEPGLSDIVDWRPDPDQPPLSDVDDRLKPYLGASARQKRVHEYGGVLRKP